MAGALSRPRSPGGNGLHTTESPRCYTIDALLAEGFPRTTIHYYVKRGILPRALSGSGRHAVYGDQHIAILRELKRRRDQRSTLADLIEWRQSRYRAA